LFLQGENESETRLLHSFDDVKQSVLSCYQNLILLV